MEISKLNYPCFKQLSNSFGSSLSSNRSRYFLRPSNSSEAYIINSINYKEFKTRTNVNSYIIVLSPQEIQVLSELSLDAVDTLIVNLCRFDCIWFARELYKIRCQYVRSSCHRQRVLPFDSIILLLR